MNKTQGLTINSIAEYLEILGQFVIRLLLLWLFIPMTAHAVSLDDLPVITFDQGEISVYRDKSNQLTLDDIRQTEIKTQFKPLQDNLNMGYTPDSVWLHFSLTRLNSQFSNRWLEIVPAYLDSIELYHINPKGQVDHRKAGDLVPQSAKEQAYRGHLFKLDFEPGQHELYLRLKSSSTMVAALKLWQPNAFGTHQRNGYFAFELYFSIILVVIIFNLMSWMASRRVIFIIYAAYLAFSGLQWLGINGFIAEFIFPEKPLLANLTLAMSIPLTITAAFIFFPIIFELRQYHRYIYRLNQFGVLLGIVTLIAAPLGYYQNIVPWLLLTAIVSLASTPWPMTRLWRTQVSWNRLLVISYSLFAILITLNTGASLGLIPFKESFIYASMAANLFEILVLYFVIMLHYTRLGIEHKKTLNEAEIMKQQVELEQKNREEQSQLLAMITHEIRTPIAIINAANESLQIIDDRTSSNQDRTLRYDRIHNAAMRMNMVMEMAIVQTEKDKLSFDVTVVNLKDLTYDVIELSGAEAEQRVVFNDLEESFTVPADLRLLRIALINLLGNALKYSPKDSPIHISIQNTTSKDGPRVSWIIDDQGLGVPDGMREKIFEKYHRGDERSNQAGMGLGLFLVARIVERHDGEIKVENNPSGGARFCLSLPSNFQ